MSRGIIYCMTTVVEGLIKIGKTGCGKYENRMYNLERHGYCNVGGLKRAFAIEVDDYDDKEDLLKDLFSKSRLSNTELFALDVELVKQLLSSLDGTQIYPSPEQETKEEVFTKATEVRRENIAAASVPDGRYYLNRRNREDGTSVKVHMVVKDGVYIVPKGEKVSAVECGSLNMGIHDARAAKLDSEGTVIEDVSFTAPSSASDFVTGSSSNGWRLWRNEKGVLIDDYRNQVDGDISND